MESNPRNSCYVCNRPSPNGELCRACELADRNEAMAEYSADERHVERDNARLEL